jgi:hypothetical protein
MVASRLAGLAGVLAFSLLAATVTLAQPPSAVDMSGWKAFRDAGLGFEVKHPPTWRVGRTSGTLESVLMGEAAQVGKPNVRMQFFVQRDINPGGLSIDRWYADQLKRLKVSAPPPSTSTVIGGRPAMRRVITTSSGTHYDFYAALHRSDVFQISIIQPSEPLDRTFEAVISTLRFVE